jgi:hypothetical protein
MSSRCMSLLPRATLHSDSEQEFTAQGSKLYLWKKPCVDTSLKGQSNKIFKLFSPPTSYAFSGFLDKPKSNFHRVIQFKILKNQL